MRIDAIELYHVAMPLISPWRTAYGEDATIESVLVRFHSGADSAWGESSPLAAPCYSPEWAGGVFAVLRDWLAPAIVGQDIASGEELQDRLKHFKGNSFAKAALDITWWALEAQRRGTPLYKLLGGKRNRFDVGADFGVMDSIGDLIAAIGPALDDGYTRVKLKYRPGWDIRMLEAVRREFPTQTFHIDCNSGYTIDDVDMFCRIDDFQLAMIEQPLSHDDVVDHARLQATIKTPVCLDESVNSVARAEQALDLGSCKYVNIKPGRVGGLTHSLAIHDMCQQAGVPCWVGGMLESSVGVHVCMALATLDNFTYPADIFPTDRFYREDLAAPAVTLVRGEGNRPMVEVPETPGIGAAPLPERLLACSRNRAVIEK